MTSFETTLDPFGCLHEKHWIQVVGASCQKVVVLVVPVPDGCEAGDIESLDHIHVNLTDISIPWKRKEEKPTENIHVQNQKPLTRETSIAIMERGEMVYRVVGRDRLFYKLDNGVLMCRCNEMGGWNRSVSKLKETDIFYECHKEDGK